MSLLNHVDVLSDASGFLVVCHHLSSEIDYIDVIKAPTARAEILEEYGSRNVGVE